MSNDKRQIQERLRKWAEETVKVYNPIANSLGYYTQSVLDRETLDPDLIILGINPGAAGGSVMTGEELLQGNPCFKGKKDNEIMDIYFNNPDAQKRRRGWNLMVKVRKMLEYADKHTLDDLDKFVLSNMVFFGTAKQGQIPKVINQDVCAMQTLELIDILKPKVVLLLGDQSRNLFKKNANITQMDELIPDYHDFYCFHKGYHVISIYHTAYYAFYTDERMKVIGYMLRYALDNPSKRIEKKQLELYISKINSNYSLAAKQTSEGDFLECNNNTIKDRAQQLKAMIKSNGSKQWIYKDILVHEYFTDVSEITGKYIKSNRMIAIDLKPECDNYKILLFTRSYDEEGARKIAEGIGQEFNSIPSNNGPRHLYKLIPMNTPDEEIASIMQELLAKVKAFRDKEYPLNR